MFITEAYAQAAGAAGGQNMYSTLIMIGVMFAAFYFLMIRPQTKRQKEHQNMVAALAKGDEVVFAGGLMGRIVKAGDTQLTIEIAEGVEVQVARAAVAQVLPKGTLK